MTDSVNRILRERRTRNTLTLTLVALGPVLAVLTGLALGAGSVLEERLLRPILLVDFVYVLLVAGLVAHRVAATFGARRRDSAGSRLHMRLMGVFAIIALLPTILVAVFATLTLNFGLEGWFSDRVRNVVGNSLAAAEAYEEEHRSNLMADAQILARFLNGQRERFPLITPSQFRELLNRGQVQMQRELPEAFVIDGAGDLRARGDRSYLFDYEPPLPEEIARAAAGETVIIEDTVNFEFRALLALSAYPDRYLYVTRDVDGDILNLLDETRETVGLYQQLERDRGRLLFEFALIYLGFALIVILAAIWLGLWFAERLSRPVGRLASAAQRVGAGDLDVQVPEDKGEDEIAMLGRVFNRMTRQVKGQRDALVEANRETERRRRLFDSILSSVTAGVVGLDAQGRIEMANSAATEHLALHDLAPGSVPLAEAIPEFAALFDRLERRIGAVTQGEVRLVRGGREEVLLVRMSTRAGSDGQVEGFVVTFDDVSDLVSAQRMAAWGDVARRIAHEIKNPLTPIQLSAERLRRKFGPIVGDQRETLEQYSDVIIRQTGDLRRIVDEFSKFARMPAPERRIADLMAVIRSAVLLQESARSDIRFALEAPTHPVMASIDETMMSQALTNLLKNATEAIDEHVKNNGSDGYAPEIRVLVTDIEGALLIQIQDNGAGLPAQRTRLFEPYVTHKEKGTGLGLSIVRKIIEEHSGQLELMDAPCFAPDGHLGAEARIVLPIGEDRLAGEPAPEAHVA
ncbi:PAS domain-containing sensor histidine kinase [Halovulum dunhuangense]|uniref:histidine kinase n=1 Tax=Halovulum dunhuangense TaxID=1505036 RepID=A0A849L2T4_9RHOB|nr:PAS domain-containing sensor histidine kinase [Halovulum dunhuangense]NNU80636.1 PAS domain-containing sensor histidine kinase [Halovulum dunhuangense]